MKTGHFLVEVPRQQRHDPLPVLVATVQIDLGEYLIGERGRHDETGVSGGATEVQQAPLGEHQQAAAVREDPLVDLVLDVAAADSRNSLQSGNVDFVVEMADVADHGLVLHPAHEFRRDHRLVAGAGDEDVGGLHDVFEARHLVALHRGLKRADRVDLGDDHAAALTPQGLGAALADFAVAADDRRLAADHQVRRPVDPIDQGVPAAVDVVELGLGHRVVDVDRRAEQRAVVLQFVQAEDSGRRLFADPPQTLGQSCEVLLVPGSDATDQLQDDAPLLRFGVGIEVRHDAASLVLDAPVDE